MLMPPLIQKWNQLKDEDKDLFPLLEVSQSDLWGRDSIWTHLILPLLCFPSTVSFIGGHCLAKWLSAIL